MNPFNLPPIHSEKLLSSHASSQAITIHIISIVQKEGEREVKRDVVFYNLEASWLSCQFRT